MILNVHSLNAQIAWGGEWWRVAYHDLAAEPRTDYYSPSAPAARPPAVGLHRAEFCTLSALQAHPALAKWAVFARKQKPFTCADLRASAAS